MTPVTRSSLWLQRPTRPPRARSAMVFHKYGSYPLPSRSPKRTRPDGSNAQSASIEAFGSANELLRNRRRRAGSRTVLGSAKRPCLRGVGLMPQLWFARAGAGHNQPLPPTRADIGEWGSCLQLWFAPGGPDTIAAFAIRPAPGGHRGDGSRPAALVRAGGPDTIAVFAIRPGRADIGGYGGSSPRATTACLLEGP